MATTKKKTKKKKPGKCLGKVTCKIAPRISNAGRRLVTEGHPESGSVLARDAKKLKAKRLQRGCLNGTFKLSAAQKRKLPPAMQKGIIAYQRKLGKKIVK